MLYCAVLSALHTIAAVKLLLLQLLLQEINK